MLPPRQCLSPGKLSRGNSDLRLKGDNDFATAHRPRNLTFQQLFQMHIRFWNRTELYRHCICGSGLCKRQNGFSDQRFFIGIASPDRNPCPCDRVDRPSLQLQVTKHAANQIISKIRYFAAFDIGKGNQKILTIQSSEQPRPRILALSLIHQPVPHNPQQLIPCMTSKSSIDHPEVFYADRDKRQLASSYEFLPDP